MTAPSATFPTALAAASAQAPAQGSGASAKTACRTQGASATRTPTGRRKAAYSLPNQTADKRSSAR
jgi:hypothetical protein